MESRWNDAACPDSGDELALRVYTSRLLGADKTLVLHGGGNTSVKRVETSLLGDREEILHVKGSGWDLETIEAAGFAPVRMEPLKRLAKLPALSDPEMVNELATRMTRAAAPAPSVEAILHAILPYPFVDHTHADAFIAVSNTADGEARIRELYGDRVVVVPYVMPGFDLARLAAQRFEAEAGPHTIGMALCNHGLFSFGRSARESYERMIELVGDAERYLARHRAWDVRLPAPQPPRADPTGTAEGAASPGPASALARATLRQAISQAAGFPMLLMAGTTESLRARGMAFAQRPDVAEIAGQGPATPDHVIRTKRVPMIGRDVAGYVDAYRAYFARHEPQARERKTMLDPAPRIVLDPALGLLAAGRSAKDATIVAEIYDHTIDVILRATALGGYRALPERDLFDVEYWDLEQAKLRKAGKPAPFAGEIALVTGAASGIGAACVAALLARGAAVVGLDRNPAIETLHRRPDYLGIACDVTDTAQLRAALERAATAYGGLDMLVCNAGVFPGGRKIAALPDDEWRTVLGVNLDANLALMREAHPLLQRAPRNGRVVIVGSKNVPAPGPGAAAYSASKAALVQLARVAALEWGEDRIRVNAVHPNAVFDTGIWTEAVLDQRARHYGLSVDEYKRNNVLHVEVTSRDVAELVAEMCGPLFAKTTGAQVPIDGGNDRVI